MPEPGFNSDIEFRGMNYHVQTEDWGLERQILISQVYQNGAVVKTFKTPYNKVLPHGRHSPPTSIRLALRAQHEKILDLLASGQLF